MSKHGKQFGRTLGRLFGLNTPPLDAEDDAQAPVEQAASGTDSEALEGATAGETAAEAVAQTAHRHDAARDEELVRLLSKTASGLAAIATNAWRARTKMVEENGEPREDSKRYLRHIESIWQALNDMGVTIEDPSGREYDPGFPLKVISYEPAKGIAHETITETLRPTVTWQSQLIQLGEVIVGVPQTEPEAAPDEKGSESDGEKHD